MKTINLFHDFCSFGLVGIKGVLLAFALLAIEANATGFSGGSGTSADPYIIANEADVQELATRTNAGESFSGVYFFQDVEITLTSPHTPIGTPTNPFKGSYDGGEYCVSNISINATSFANGTNCWGYFGYVKNATVQNVLTFGTIRVSGGYTSGMNCYAGGCIGVAYDSILQALENHCSVSLTATALQPSSVGQHDLLFSAGGCVGVIRCNQSYTYRSFCNYGNVTCVGMVSHCSVAGCASMTLMSDGTHNDMFVECENHGKIDGVAGSAASNPSLCSGVAAIAFKIYGGGAPAFLTRDCLNYGDVSMSGSAFVSGVQSAYVNAAASETDSCCRGKNYGSISASGINANIAFSVAGVSAKNPVEENYSFAKKIGLENHGDITVSVTSGAGKVPVAGCAVGDTIKVSSASPKSSGINYGDINVNVSQGLSVRCFVAGVFTLAFANTMTNVFNFGNISVSAPSCESAMIAGCVSAGLGTSQSIQSVMSSCGNIGNINATFPSTANNHKIAGLLCGMPLHPTYITNCYSIGIIKANAGTCGKMVSTATPNSGVAYVVNNCYAFSDGVPMFGNVNASSSVPDLSNNLLVGNSGNEQLIGTTTGEPITTGSEVKSYSSVYSNPSLMMGFLKSWAFNAPTKTADYDLQFPSAKKQWSTLPTDIAKAHQYWTINGFKKVEWRDATWQ